MVKIFNLVKKTKHSLKNSHSEEERFLFHKYYYEKTRLFKSIKNLCILCNRFLICRNIISKNLPMDFHSFDHKMLNNYPKHIPVNSFRFSIDDESSMFNIHLEKNFPTYESFSFYMSKSSIIPMESFYYTNNFRKKREYLFLKYRISKYFRKKCRKKFNGKNFLHSWNDIKCVGKNWNSQRGEILVNLIQNPKKKKNINKKQKFGYLYKQNIIFFRIINKKIYENELIKRLICTRQARLGTKNCFTADLRNIQITGFFNLYQYLSDIFFFTNSKFLNTETNSIIRFNFFEYFFFFSAKKIRFFNQFIQKFF